MGLQPPLQLWHSTHKLFYHLGLRQPTGHQVKMPQNWPNHYVLRDQYFHFFSWLLAGNSYMVTLWWCLTYTLIYLLVTRPPFTILTWPLESRWLFTNTCSVLAVTWTYWVSSTSPLLIYSSAWLVPRHALLISLLFSVTQSCTLLYITAHCYSLWHLIVCVTLLFSYST